MGPNQEQQQERYLFGDLAKKYAQENLLTQLNSSASAAKEAITSLQDKFLSKESDETIFEILKVSRFQIFKEQCDQLIEKVIHRIMDDTVEGSILESLLVKCIEYRESSMLHTLILTLFKVCPRIPPIAVDYYKEHPDLCKELSLEVRRKVWLLDNALFRQEIFSMVNQYHVDQPIVGLNDDTLTSLKERRHHSTVLTLQEMVGDNIQLYNIVLGFFRTLFISTGFSSFCSLRFDLLMAMHDVIISDVFEKDPCHQIAPVLESVVHKQSLSNQQIHNIQEFFDDVESDSPALGEISMILNDPCILSTLTGKIWEYIDTASGSSLDLKECSNLKWLCKVLSLPFSARAMIQERKFHIPRLDKQSCYTSLKWLFQVTKNVDHCPSEAIESDLSAVVQCLSNNVSLKMSFQHAALACIERGQTSSMRYLFYVLLKAHNELNDLQFMSSFRTMLLLPLQNKRKGQKFIVLLNNAEFRTLLFGSFLIPLSRIYNFAKENVLDEFKKHLLLSNRTELDQIKKDIDMWIDMEELPVLLMPESTKPINSEEDLEQESEDEGDNFGAARKKRRMNTIVID